MNVLKQILQIVVALSITFALITGFRQFKLYNERLNQISNYSIVEKDDNTINELNDFLKNHGSTYTLNYEQDKEILENDLEYYSFWEKVSTSDHDSKSNTEEDDNTLNQIESYYDMMDYLKQSKNRLINT